MVGRWSQFLRGPERCNHGVQIYADVAELSGSVAAYLSAGFKGGEPAAIVATRDHWVRFADALRAEGWDPYELQLSGRLIVADAEETLATFMAGGAPSAAAFERSVGGVFDELERQNPGRHVRAFGEMVDVLTSRGEEEAAFALEHLWNDLASRRDFSLLCGYQLDVFDLAAQRTMLPPVCRSHTHVMPARDLVRFSRAVDRALEEILGSQQAGRVYVVVSDEIREERVPVAQLALMWVSANMPGLADRVLERARAHYAALPA
jgi:hypothetical protein